MTGARATGLAGTPVAGGGALPRPRSARHRDAPATTVLPRVTVPVPPDSGPEVGAPVPEVSRLRPPRRVLCWWQSLPALDKALLGGAGAVAVCLAGLPLAAGDTQTLGVVAKTTVIRGETHTEPLLLHPKRTWTYRDPDMVAVTIRATGGGETWVDIREVREATGCEPDARVLLTGRCVEP